jgi:hypothetical protein
MRKAASFAVLAALLVALPAGAAPADEHPGYGVVEQVIDLRQAQPEESASAGASAPSATPSRRSARYPYLVRVRLDDGSIQVREARKKLSKGARVLVTNAGDVVPE